MRNVPRILPLVGVAVGGVLAINALSGAQALPDLLSGAKALAEDAKPDKASKDHKDAKGEAAAVGEAKDAAAQKPAMPVMPGATPKPVAVCAPTAAELAREAGLSPAELQVLQSLGARRGQLDQREQQLDVQLALMAAAEAKVDAKLKALNGLKADINGLLKQTDAKEDAEVDRLVKVFEAMKPKDAAPRIVLLDDSVRLPIAARMKERALSAVLANMPAPEAKKLTEALARRFATARAMAEDVQAKAKAAEAAAAAAPAKTAEAKPPQAKPAAKRAGPKKTAQAAKPAAPAEAGKDGEAPAAKAG